MFKDVHANCSVTVVPKACQHEPIATPETRATIKQLFELSSEGGGMFFIMLSVNNLNKRFWYLPASEASRGLHDQAR